MEDGMEKRNVIEDGRTPIMGLKIAEEVEKAASDIKFNITERSKKENKSDESKSTDNGHTEGS